MVFLQKNQNLTDKQFWHSLSGDFHIEDHDFARSINEYKFSQEQYQKAQDLIKTEGYFQAQNIFNTEDTDKYASLIKALVSKQLLPIFCFIYDEFWLCQRKLQNLITSSLGENYSLRPCLWAWHLDPEKEEAGWKPHRDGNIESLNQDLSPKVLSLWIPLSDANTLNGFMYLVPMNREAEKPHEVKQGWDFNLPDVRALPAQAGDAFIWNHWVVHWGSRASKRAAEPRISLGFELECQGSNILAAPLLDPTKLPSFSDRLKIIAYQILQYTHMYQFTNEMLDFAKTQLPDTRLSADKLEASL